MTKKRAIVMWLLVAVLALSTVPAMASDGDASEGGILSWLEGVVSALLSVDEPTLQMDGDGEPDPDTGEVGDGFEPFG